MIASPRLFPLTAVTGKVTRNRTRHKRRVRSQSSGNRIERANRMNLKPIIAAIVAATATLATPVPAAERGPVTNLPLPCFVSLKADEGNARRGPSLSHRIDWVFTRRNMPLEVTGEYGHWRRVQDRDGQGGDVLLGQVAVAGQQARGVPLPVGVLEGEEHRQLRDQERAEADVGALLAEELPEFAA